MKYTITFLEPIFETLISTIFEKEGLEGAAYLLCRISRTPTETRLLVQDLVPVRDDDYLRREPLRLSIKSDSYVPVAKRAKESKQSILFVHSHPSGHSEFSVQDDLEEPRLMDFFKKRVPEGVHGAIVASSRSSLIARVSNGTTGAQVSRIRIIGQRFHFVDAAPPGDDPLPHFFDRQVRAFGPDIQRLLSRLHIGVVGAGGTGSAVFEQLVRLGIGRISIFDHDDFDATNVNRVYGSGADDSGRKKVDIAQASADRVKIGTRIERYPKGINHEPSARALRDCDIVFSCTDKQGPRGILTQLALRYLIPMLDLGAVIKSTDGMIGGIFGRVTTFFPGEACLFCRERITSEAIRLEGLKPEEHAALAREGYAPELETNAPAVIMFTTAVAAQAVSELLHRLTGFMGDTRASTEVLHKFHETEISRNRQLAKANCVCSQRTLWGRGDSKYFLDLSWKTDDGLPPK